MWGAHLDSWQGATGATDNAAGSIVMMEAVRILRALNIQPRRTIRIALWSGEEEGLRGSKDYVKKTFGDTTTLQLLPAHQKFDVYFNVDNGTGKLQRIDLTTEKVVWEKFFEGGCDRMSISPDGKIMYLPSLENKFWNVVDCATGDIIKKIGVNERAHNTIYGPSGNFVYLDDIASPWVYIADAKTNSLVNKIGPFGNFVRPFTINGKETLVYATIDSLLGFEVGDIKTGKKLARIEVQGWDTGPVRRHGNPSHGIGLT